MSIRSGSALGLPVARWLALFPFSRQPRRSKMLFTQSPVSEPSAVETLDNQPSSFSTMFLALGEGYLSEKIFQEATGRGVTGRGVHREEGSGMVY